MTYREPDPQRSREVREDEENREALERLAAAGMRRREALALQHEAARAAERARTAPARFRRRAWRSERKLLFVPVWELTCLASGLVAGVVELILRRDPGDAIGLAIIVFILANASILAALPVMLVYAIYAAIWRRLDARALLAWRDALPFPLERFTETLSLDRDLDELRVLVRFSADAPDAAIVEGLLGNLASPDGLKLVSGPRGHAIYRSGLVEGDSPPNGLVVHLRELVEKVLLPLHAVHAIERAVVSEPASGETWSSGDARERVTSELGK